MRVKMSIAFMFLTSTASAGSVPAHHALTSADRDRHDSALLTHHESTHASLDLANQIARPPVMYDTSHWSHQAVEHIWYSGLYSYSATGHVPDTNLWKYLQWRSDLDPSRFYHYHPFFEGMFVTAPYVGLLPDGAFWNKLEKRYELDPARFDQNNPALAIPTERNANFKPDPPPDPSSDPDPAGPLNTVYEPSSHALLMIGATCVLIVVLHEAMQRRKQAINAHV